jgi:Fe2+ transport system protein FeoA
MMSLSMVSPGEDVRLVAIHGGQQMRKRLADLGLNVGMTVRVVQRNGHGPLILAVKDSRLAVGHGMAHKILVQPC